MQILSGPLNGHILAIVYQGHQVHALPQWQLRFVQFHGNSFWHKDSLRMETIALVRVGALPFVFHLRPALSGFASSSLPLELPFSSKSL
jgi:hypothetical protein